VVLAQIFQSVFPFLFWLQRVTLSEIAISLTMRKWVNGYQNGSFAQVFLDEETVNLL